ncbi:MAG: L-iditol 2-dehydrogenase [Planctomycetes bacterium GWF2_41_51]|nr:MAG: L-iditol 2-dehydrogenase [Planctomycetes bacterium GWF2_41_51]HBG27066.1 L-iditol 2-dehydrogenase [Phycisphaerales bacterium]
MKAAVFAGPNQIKIYSVEIPQPKKNQVRIKLQGCGICASNLPVWQGREWFKYPLEPGYPGHEGWGIIDDVGDNVSEFKKGQRVAFLSDHSYCEYENVNSDAVVKLPDSLNKYPFLGEPFACAMNILKRSELQAGQKIAIIGIGFLGAMLTSLAAQQGCEVIAISRRPFSLSVAKNKGAAHTILMENKYDIIKKVKELTNSSGCQRVIEAVGNQESIELAGELISIKGKLIIAGYHQDGLRKINMQVWNWKGIDVINAHEREMSVYLEGIRSAITAIEKGDFWPFDLLTNSYTIEQLPNAFEDMQKRPDGFMKAYLIF